MDKKEIVCKCGNNKWIYESSMTLTCMPPINKTTYRCDICGEKHTTSHQEKFNNIGFSLYE